MVAGLTSVLAAKSLEPDGAGPVPAGLLTPRPEAAAPAALGSAVFTAGFLDGTGLVAPPAGVVPPFGAVLGAEVVFGAVAVLGAAADGTLLLVAPTLAPPGFVDVAVPTRGVVVVPTRGVVVDLAAAATALPAVAGLELVVPAEIGRLEAGGAPVLPLVGRFVSTVAVFVVVVGCLVGLADLTKSGVLPVI